MVDFNTNYSATQPTNMNSFLIPYNWHPANTNQPTWISRTTSSLLEYITTDKMINSQYITDTFLFSHHLGYNAVLDDVITMKQKIRITVKHNKTDYSVSQFNHDLIRADWNQIFSTKSVNQQLNIFLRIFCEILQKQAPRKIAFVRNPPKFETKNKLWFDEGCRAALDGKQETHREYQKTQCKQTETLPRATKPLKTNLERCHEQHNPTLFQSLKSTKDRRKFINNQ